MPRGTKSQQLRNKPEMTKITTQKPHKTQNGTDSDCELKFPLFPSRKGNGGNFHRASILWHVCLFAEVYSVEPSSECSCVSACLSWLSTCVSLSGVAASFNRIMIFISTLLEKLLNFYAFAVWLKELQQGSLNFLKASFSPQYVM